MKAIAVFVLLLVCAVGAVCQKPAPAKGTPTKPAAKAAVQQTATLVFYREKRFYGTSLKPQIYVNGEEIAKLDNGRFFVLALKPGTYQIEFSPKQDALQVEAKPGKTEVLELLIISDSWKGEGRLIPADTDNARDALAKLKPLDAKYVQSEDVTFELPGEVTAEAK
jgi:hypothetical protein